MDGYMDTVDALFSHQPQERKLKILKDPHCGAFAIIYCGIYLLLQAGMIYELYETSLILALCLLFVVSRSLSALCALHLPSARSSGMLYAYTENVERFRVTICLVMILILSCAAMLRVSFIPAVVSLFFMGGAVLMYRRIVMKQFGGVTGDTAGFFLQICELSGMIGAWLGGCML